MTIYRNGNTRKTRAPEPELEPSPGAENNNDSTWLVPPLSSEKSAGQSHSELGRTMVARRNIDGGTLPLSVLRRAPRERRSLAFLWPALLLMSGAAAVAVLWWSVFGPMFAKPDVEAPATAGTKPNGSGEKAGPVAPAGPTESQLRILDAAKSQLEAGIVYSGEYFQMAYPGGDVPANVGTSADLLIRALRQVGVDLQTDIPRHRQLRPGDYPKDRWKAGKPDTNVDHRRLANIYMYLKHHAKSLTTSTSERALADYQPGDIVMWTLRDGKPYPDHAGIVSDKVAADGMPYVVDIHPKTGRISGDHRLDEWPVRGHFRFLSPTLDPAPPGEPLSPPPTHQSIADSP
jgi:hypothetical protein